MCEWGKTEKVVVCVDGVFQRVDVDSCIAGFVYALNSLGWPTVASCCGHGKHPGNIVLADGRELLICPDFATARKVDAAIKAASEGVPS